MVWRDKFAKIAPRTESGLWSVNKIMVYVASVALFGMMMVTVADVIGRYFFASPIKGAWELTGFLLICAGPWAMAYCQLKKGHIRVDFIQKRLPEKVQAILTSFACLVGLAAFSAMCWRSILLTQYYFTITRGNATDTLHIPIYPFALMLAIGAGMLALVLLVDLINSLAEVKRK